MSTKISLTEEEKRIAKQNGFILTGKTGAGKSNLINSICGQEIALVGDTSKSETQESKVFYYKLENGKCICLVDTPGLSDSNMTKDEKTDKRHLESITKVINEESINLKGILFLINFQNERIDNSEEDALLNYNGLFPLKKFWEHVILIFTHYHGGNSEIDDESPEEKKALKDNSNREIFTDIMNRIKEISDVVNYYQIGKMYCDCVALRKAKKEETKAKIIKNNIQIRDELEILLNNLMIKDPLFNQIEIATYRDQIYERDGKRYKGTIKKIGFMLFENILYEQTIYENEKEISKNQPCPKPCSPDKVALPDVVVINAKNKNNKYIPNYEKGNAQNSNYIKRHTGAGALIGGSIGAAAGAAIGCTSSVTTFVTTIAGISAATGPVGWIIGGAAIGVGVVGAGIGALIGHFTTG